MPVKPLRGKAHPAKSRTSRVPREVCMCSFRACIIARNPQAGAIKQALDGGTPLTEVIRTFDVKRKSLVHHRNWLKQRTASPPPPPMEDSPPRPSQATVLSAWPCPHSPQTLLADGLEGRLRCQECGAEETPHGSDALRNLLADATRQAWQAAMMRGLPDLMQAQRASADLFVRIVHEMVSLRDSAQGRERP